MEEWRNWPPGFLEQVIEDRAFAAAWRTVRNAKDKKSRQAAVASGPLHALASAIEFDLAQE